MTSSGTGAWQRPPSTRNGRSREVSICSSDCGSCAIMVRVTVRVRVMVRVRVGVGIRVRV